MSTQILHINIDSDTKKGAFKRAEDLGLSLTSYVNMVLKQSLRQDEIVLTPTKHLEDMFSASRKDVKAGRVSRFDDDKKLLQHLKSLKG